MVGTRRQWGHQAGVGGAGGEQAPGEALWPAHLFWGTDKAPHAGVAPESGELNTDLYFLLMACSSPHRGPGGTAAWAEREEPPAAPPYAMPPPLAVLGEKRRCPPPLLAPPLLTPARGPGRQSPGEGVRLCHFSEDSVN